MNIKDYKEIDCKLKYAPLVIFGLISGTAVVNNFGYDLINNDMLTYAFIGIGGILAHRVRIWLENPSKLLREMIPIIKFINDDNCEVNELLKELERVICEDDDVVESKEQEIEGDDDETDCSCSNSCSTVSDDECC